MIDSVAPNLVYNTINDLQRTNSLRSDGINIKIIKACAHIVQFLLTSIFNKFVTGSRNIPRHTEDIP